MTSRKQNLRKVMKRMDYMTPEEISANLQIKVSTINKYISEIIAQEQLEFNSTKKEEWMSQAFTQYQKIREEGWLMYNHAKAHGDIKEMAIGLAKVKEAQVATDDLFKKAGIYHDVSVNVNIDLTESPQFLQFQKTLLDFFRKKNIDPAEFFEYIRALEEGDHDPPLVAPVTVTEIKDSNRGTRDDTYERHRRQRNYHRTKGNSERVLQSNHGPNSNRNVSQPYNLSPHVQEIHVLEALDMKGTITEEQKGILRGLRIERDILDKEEERRVAAEEYERLHRKSPPPE